MAKKIKVALVIKASGSLKKRKIEHVLVQYKNEADAFLVVMNKDINSAKAALTEDEFTILKIENVRHYEDKALNHSHYQPTFDCVCRGCGKTFKHVDKNAKWCSKKCRSDYRYNKKLQSQTTPQND